MVLESVLKHGRIIRGYLGIQTSASQRGAGDADTGGVPVGDVLSGSPAEQAGLQPGDVILKFDGRDVKSFKALRTLVAGAPLDKQVELQIVRNGKPLTLKTQIKEQPLDYETAGVAPSGNQARPQGPQQPDDQEDADSPLASIHVDELAPEKARQLDLPPNVKGVLVTNVDPDSGMAELQKGDVIEEINQQPVTSVSDYNKIVTSLDPNQPQVLSVCRHRARSFLVLRPR
jgi:serine protease Do